MPQRRRPKRGSRAFGPRKRAQSQTPRLDSWPEINGTPKIQGFAGYKAGMTHAFIVDKRAKSTTSGMEIQVPVTVVEVPPMKIAAVRFYENSIVGLKTAGEVWAKDLDPLLERRLSVPKNHDEATFARYDGLDIEDVRVIAYTQPKMVSGVPKKVPDIMELRIGGGTIDERVAYAKQILGTEVNFTDFIAEGALTDVIAVTKGKGFQGVTKRWGVRSAGVSSSCPTGTASTAAESVTSDPRDPDTSGPQCPDPDRWDTTRGPSSTRRSSKSAPRVPKSLPGEDSSTTERSGTPTFWSTDPFPAPPRG